MISTFSAVAEIATGRPAPREAQVQSLHIVPGGGSHTHGIARYAVGADGPVNIIVKTLTPGGRSFVCQDWQREAFAYADLGFCDGVKGLRFPRCYLVEVVDARHIRLFLEDVGRLRHPDNADDSAVAAALGHFAAAAHAEGLWKRPWLVNTAAPIVTFRSNRLWQGLRSLLPAKVAQRAFDSFELLKRIDAETLRSALPQTVVHGDVHRGNCFMSGSEVVLIDLAMLSKGPIGHDLANYAVPLGRLLRWRKRRVSLAAYQEIERRLITVYKAILRDRGVVYDERVFDDNFDFQIAMNCARTLSRSNMLAGTGRFTPASDVAKLLANIAARAERLAASYPSPESFAAQEPAPRAVCEAPAKALRRSPRKTRHVPQHKDAVQLRAAGNGRRNPRLGDSVRAKVVGFFQAVKGE